MPVILSASSMLMAKELRGCVDELLGSTNAMARMGLAVSSMIL